jgi:hypothetical protein
MESPKSVAELISAVQQEYEVSYEQAERDVKQFLSDTLSVGLVEERQEVSLAALNSSEREEMRSAGTQ